jgi:hypothetical protein
MISIGRQLLPGLALQWLNSYIYKGARPGNAMSKYELLLKDRNRISNEYMDSESNQPTAHYYNNNKYVPTTGMSLPPQRRKCSIQVYACVSPPLSRPPRPS